jgi:dienelactone hydrolase
MRLRTAALVSLLVSCATPGGKTSGPEVTVAASVGGEEVVVAESLEVTTETVEFASGALKLVGTVLRPEGTGQWPGVIITYDWGVRGQQGLMRESFGVRLPAEVAVYRSLAESLAGRGFAVLIYDKRNCAADSEPWCSYPAAWATVRPDVGAAWVEDAVAASKFMQARADVSTVSLVGHGHGAEVALLAAKQVSASGAILLAPPSSDLQARAEFQLSESLRLIDGRIAELGDVPEADLLKTRRTEIAARLQAKADLLGLSEAARVSLDELHQRYLSAVRDGVPLVAIAAVIDPGEPSGARDRLEAMFGEQLMWRGTLSRMMVEIGDELDSTVLSAGVVTRVAEFLNRTAKP